MLVTLLPDHVDTLLESVQYSKERVRSTVGIPQELRNEKLAKLDAAENWLRATRSQLGAVG
jgi:hypothetical protein